METFICILVGYLIGTLSPSALISRLKHKDLRESGTGNLGATNTMLVFGKKFGVIVMLFDFAKAYLTMLAVKLLVPHIPWLWMAAGLAVVVGHCFPFYMGFKGGKGLASFGGLVLAYDPLLFTFLASTGIALMLIVNHSFILPYYAAVFFTVRSVIIDDLIIFLLVLAVSALIITVHLGNLIKAISGKDRKIREYIRTKLFRAGNTE